MPTARELLEQADALMRRNRTSAADAKPARVDVPVLTEVVEAPADAFERPSSSPALATMDAEISDKWRRPDTGSSIASSALDDVPVLTDVVEEIEAPTIGESFDEDPSQWAVERDAAARADVDAHGPATGASREVLADAHPAAASPSTDAAQPPTDDVDELALDELEATSEPPSENAADGAQSERERAATGADDDAEWEALGEEIRIQVLQRIDMFTDTGLRERLGERLKPIVDRASADLVAAINQHVGEILRAYVAEAIEREIDRWKSGR